MRKDNSPDDKAPQQRRAFIGGFGEAWAGIFATVSTQRNMRFHVIAAVVVFASGVFLGASRVELAILALAISLVLAFETLNTAVEAVVDLVTEGERHPLAGLAKDAAAGAVLVTTIGSVVVGFLILADEALEFLSAAARFVFS